MQRIPLGQYAKKMRMSRAQVIKKILSGDLRAEEVMENGKKVRYILVESEELPPVQSRCEEILAKMGVKPDMIFEEDGECFALVGKRLLRIRDHQAKWLDPIERGEHER